MNFHDRLRDYYNKVAQVLRGEAEAASVFPNSTDIGVSRERVYAEFLRQHSPSKCTISFGGFLFHIDGTESKQLDIIVTTDTTPRYDFHNRDGGGKCFSPVEGTLAVASIKSTLDKAKLFESLDEFASIPPTEPLNNRVPFLLKMNDYTDWPYKIIYANKGLRVETILEHLNDYYKGLPQVPLGRRPNVIHVAGKYVIFKADPGYSTYDRDTGTYTPHEAGSYCNFTNDCDLQAICWVLNNLQQNAAISTHILFNYGELIRHLNKVPAHSSVTESTQPSGTNQ